MKKQQKTPTIKEENRTMINLNKKTLNKLAGWKYNLELRNYDAVLNYLMDNFYNIKEVEI